MNKLAMAAVVALSALVAAPAFADSPVGSGNGAHGEVGDNPNATAMSAPALNGKTDCLRNTNIGISYAVCPADVGNFAVAHSLSDPAFSNGQQAAQN